MFVVNALEGMEGGDVNTGFEFPMEGGRLGYKHFGFEFPMEGRKVGIYFDF